MKPESHKPGVMAHASNPGTGEMETRYQNVQVYPWVYSEFEAILG